MGSYALIIIVMMLSLLVQWRLNSRFNKYSRVPSPQGMTGADIARRMLAENGINDVEVDSIPGRLTDHYDPRTRVINLSESVYGQASIAACAVAAHETGHAIQHAKGYGPLKLRTAMVPVVNFASNSVQWVLLIGVLTLNVFPQILMFGIALFAMTTLFSFVTLPVEINASARAIKWMTETGIVAGETRRQSIDALKWAAYTYVVAALGSLATLFYYIGLSRRN